MRSMANKARVFELAHLIGKRVPALSGEFGRPAYSGAIKVFWEEFRAGQEDAQKWHLYPNATEGEYLADFMLLEDGYGPRIACESELAPRGGDVEWDFDKLRGIKADIKVLIHQCDSKELMDKLKTYLADNALITRDEAYLLVKLCRDKTESHWWKPEREGPFTATEINFQPIPA